ncbi:MAG TPA: glycerol-3-phosphate dehydrogenase/oxidase [Terriglobales bacterium]|jgi:glycerol-3-phosphate dehydrogenase|nr:glycerol-3-phosphate dehydrogenase/oxidase [Terriglobales bacterium]
MNTPRTIRGPLEDEHFQVIVIGGGINGVAIARECARAGRRTLLVEQQDFASGTTSRSTRIIHGGLRYLEHGELGLVRESLRERKSLLRQYPHLVNPLQFLLALDQKSRRNALGVRTGLWLYRRMGGKSLAANSAGDQHKLERLLDSGRQWSVFNFEDAQCEFPERLVVEWLVEAIEAGAVVRNYTQVLAVDVRHGRAQGVLLRDQLTKKEFSVHGTWIINATGPWVDRVCQRSRVDTNGQMVGGIRGSHIVLPRFAGAPEAAVYTEAIDGRPFFVIPWNDQVLVGTTEAADNGDPAKTQPSQEEIQYLLDSFLHLFPRAKISYDDIHYAFAGVRPLPYSAKKNASDISRKHYLHDHTPDGAAQMISVIGGKLTTAAQLARECAAKIGARAKTVSSSSVAMVSEDRIDPLLDRWVLDIAEAGGISEESARGIVEWHGKRARNIAHMALSSAELRAPLCPHTVHIVAEAVDGFVNECAVTLADVLLRRVPVALGQCWSPSCSREAAGRIRAVMGWNDGQAAAELETFETERETFLRKPPRMEPALLAAAD